MQTLRQVVSDLSGDLKALNIDDRLSYRFLASKFKDKVQVFIRQDARSRELVKEASIWKPIRCVDLVDVNAIDCHCVNDDCTTIKKSKIKIPEAYSTTYGNLIKVFTLDGSQEYNQIKPTEYKEKSNREYGSGHYFWLENGYIFIADSTLRSVKILEIAKSPLEIDIINGDKSICTSPLDEELNYPPYLITVGKQAVKDELLGSKNIVVDEKPNENQNQKV